MSEIIVGHGGPASPFDAIRRVDESGEYWLAREMQPFLDYREWRNIEKVVVKARASCRNNGQEPRDHFVDVNKMVEVGSGATRSVADYRLSRYGCYLIAMNGDPEKPEVAAAQGYFAAMTRHAELNRPPVLTGQPSFANRPWSVRFVETIQPHMRAVYEINPDGFTVLTTLATPMLGLEDELIRHLFDPQPSDRPDVSIGLCWSNNRRDRGLEPSDCFAPLYLPDKKRTVHLSVYNNSERGGFERWYREEYMPEKLPAYLGNKPEFGRRHPLSAASVADHACLKMTGRSANLKPPVRHKLDRAGNFFPVGTELPALPGDGQLMLWDRS